LVLFKTYSIRDVCKEASDYQLSVVLFPLEYANYLVPILMSLRRVLL